MLGEFKKFMASCPCSVFLSVHNRDDMYSYEFVYLSRRAVYSGQFVCVCVALAVYERPPVRKSPIWSRHAAILYIRQHKHLKVRPPNLGKFFLTKTHPSYLFLFS